MSFPLHKQVRLYWQKRREYERNERRWRKLRMQWHFLRRDSYLRFPVNGNLLEALDEGRADIGPWVLIERGCWFSLYPETATMRIGHGTIVNLGCMIAATDRIDVGEHCMFANHCFLTDADHRFDDPDMPITWQGMTPKGPVKIGDNCWFGTNCVVTGGVTIGDRTVVGANSVVTRDLPRRSDRRRRAREGHQGDRVPDVRLADDLTITRALARMVVEVAQHELLPGAGQYAAVLDRHGLGGADDRRLQVRVGVRVALHLVVVVGRVRAGRAGPSAPSGPARRPASYSISVIAAVECDTNTFTIPSLMPEVSTTSSIPRVMSMMSPSPSVETRIWALWTGTAAKASGASVLG